jgi:DNA invertase Pin-like site-specific DNA recombinase
LGELVGYARVSTNEQNLALQLDALHEHGCTRVFRDVGSGSLKHRPQLEAVLDYLRPGQDDVLVVWRLDRLGRGLRHLIDLVEQLHDREINFRSLTEQLDTTTPAGKLQFHIFGALAEFERDVIRERTRAGLTAARARGRLGGRPTKMTSAKIELARIMRERDHLSMTATAKALGVGRTTLYRHLSPPAESTTTA